MLDAVETIRVALVAEGQTVGADCGGVAEGPAALSVVTKAGALDGTLAVVGVLCEPARGRCPAPLPVTQG